MNYKKKNILNEPAELYEINQNTKVSLVGFDVLGNKINHKELIEDIESALFELKNGKLNFKSVSEIRK